MKLVNAQIRINEQLPHNNDFYYMELLAPYIAANAVPGQFVMLTPAPTESPFLKRPMGINSIDKQNGTVSVIYQLKGKGTHAMSSLCAGEYMDILGPLGNGWKSIPDAKRICMIGGGSGVATLQPLAAMLWQQGIRDMDFIFGGKSSAQILCMDAFAQMGNLLLATEDGSIGRQGMVDVYFDTHPQYDIIYTCGPVPMMRKAALWAAKANIPCQVSLEERMGCGYGVCVGCVCETRSTDEQISYKRVCREGPVFDGKEVFFNE